MRIAVLNKDKCHYKNCNYLCRRLCPKVKIGSKTITVNEETKLPEINELMCTGCGICVNKCPKKAISIVNLPEELKEPIFQYGKNGFRLYNFLYPKEGVIGLIGKNGIGKSTILKILSGLLKVNFGKQEISNEEIIEHFKGKEIQQFFIELLNAKDKKLMVSYKPQYVELLRKFLKGKNVEEVIKNDLNKEENLINSLRINYLSKKVENLSGGELQKLAIFACLSKDAKIYLLDEPSSYLDVEERLNFAKVVENFAQERKKPVVVVEHDLIILDYLSDYIHVIFGKPSVYGIVSSLKPTRTGINEYLEGYLKAENMRFREEIKFDIISAKTKKFPYLLTKYPKFKKTFTEFILNAEEGEIYKGQVIGILGKNASGKTTFIKILAGVEKDDENSINLGLKVSYKPQYIETNDNLVSQLHLNYELVRDFEIGEFLDKRISELSGGELQKVAIADCLSKDADIYLLDEPSAYLDVEERLKLAKYIRNFAEKNEKSMMIVDHDIMFIDYISDNLIVFESRKESSIEEGFASSVLSMRDGMNKFLKGINLTFRRDIETKRPRINKIGSVKDREQKEKGEYYYFES